MLHVILIDRALALPGSSADFSRVVTEREGSSDPVPGHTHQSTQLVILRVHRPYARGKCLTV